MNEIAPIVENPVACLTDAQAYDALLARMKAEIVAHTPDVSTAKGRQAIKSLAFKITRSKTAIDDAGKKLNEDKRAEINKVDAERRRIRDELDALAAEARKPLTDWETKEEERKRDAARIHNRILEIGRLSPGDGSNVIADRLGAAEAIVVDRALFDEGIADMVLLDQQKVIADLKVALDRAKQHEADQAELAQLRQIEAQRERERLAAEQAAKEAADRKAYAEAVAKQAAETERAKAQEAIAKAEREKQAAIAEARRREAEAVAAAEAEARRVKEQAIIEEHRRKEAEEAARRADEQRAADRQHRMRIMNAATAALMTRGVEDDLATSIVMAIADGQIPNVKMVF